jgi:hypothetical protein
MELFKYNFYIKDRNREDQIIKKNNIILSENLEQECLHITKKKINYLSSKLMLLQINDKITNINNIPSSIHSLLLDDKFNENRFKLPFKLKKLSVGNKFNKKINKLNNLTILIVGKNLINNCNNLPKSLKQLSLRTSFFDIEHKKPSITNINRMGYLTTKMYFRISLPSLNLDTEITINKINKNHFTFPLFKNSLYMQYLNNLPQLIMLILSNDYNNKINYAPQSLKKLICGDCYNHEIDDLSQNLNIITLMSDFNKYIKKAPLNLKRIVFINNTHYNNKISKIFKKYKFVNAFESKELDIDSNIFESKELDIDNEQSNNKFKIKEKFNCERFSLLSVNKFDESIYYQKLWKAHRNEFKLSINKIKDRYEKICQENEKYTKCSIKNEI